MRFQVFRAADARKCAFEEYKQLKIFQLVQIKFIFKDAGLKGMNGALSLMGLFCLTASLLSYSEFLPRRSLHFRIPKVNRVSGKRKECNPNKTRSTLKSGVVMNSLVFKGIFSPSISLLFPADHGSNVSYKGKQWIFLEFEFLCGIPSPTFSLIMTMVMEFQWNSQINEPEFKFLQWE